MNKDIGYDYEDVLKIKQELGLYNITNIRDFDSLEFESIDMHYQENNKIKNKLKK